MQKITSLRRALEEAIPALRTDPQALAVWVENGNAQCQQTTNESFGFTYTLNVLLKETNVDLALISLAIFRWLRVNQPDLLSPQSDGISFDVDILDAKSWDVAIQLNLREQVSVTLRDDGGHDLAYLPEPDPGPVIADLLGAGGADPIPPLTEVQTTGEIDF